MPLHLVHYVIAGLLLLAEAFSPGTFLFICFALATAITGGIEHIWQLGLKADLAIDLGLSVFFLFTVRPFLKSVVKIPAEMDPQQYGSYSEKLIGREAMVFKPISKTEPGLVKLLDYDETWLAKPSSDAEIGQGATVVIEKIDGNHLIVNEK
ncbi:MAG: NfeD family protein [Candidatus Melainabacteria bacterium]|nr:NfeD family protein [Candidatus Melainabacteria bacterium]